MTDEEINNGAWYHNEPGDQIWWKETLDTIGEWVFSFDRVTEFNMFQDYPWKLTPAQKELFDRENPYWADFFQDRQ